MHFILLIFFFNDTATTEIYTLSLHDALPIYRDDRDAVVEVFAERALLDHLREVAVRGGDDARVNRDFLVRADGAHLAQIGEHTSELQSRQYLVCRLLLEKNKKHRMRA